MLNRFFNYKNTTSLLLYNKRLNFLISKLSSTNSTGVELQNRINELLNKSFPNAKEIIVKDISGGCGSMFEIYISSIEFNGMTKVKQHLTISNILKNEIRDMHGIRIFTEVPSD